MQPQRYWREIPHRYRYEAGKCKKCGKTFIPDRLVCDKCGAREFETVNLPQTGKVATYSIIHVAASQFLGQTPYAVGIVELDGGVKLTAQIVDVEHKDLKIGMPVKLEFRKIQEVGEAGVICYGYKAVPT